MENSASDFPPLLVDIEGKYQPVLRVPVASGSKDTCLLECVSSAQSPLNAKNHIPSYPLKVIPCLWDKHT